MWKSSVDSVCLVCQFQARLPRPRLQTAPSWPSQRSYATVQARRPPSRMILSDDVAQPPSRRDARKPTRNKVAGPFAGMNRTVANVDSSRRPLKSRASSKASGRGSKDDDEKKDTSFKALKMHRALATVGYGHRTRAKAQMASFESFDQFHLRPEVLQSINAEALKGLVGIKPSAVQRLAIPALLGQRTSASPRASRNKIPEPEGKQEFLIAAETGSGKTLAYLLPAINALKAAEAKDEDVAAYNERLAEEKEKRGSEPMSAWIDDFEPHPHRARPRVVVLVPSAELVDQVTAVAKRISHIARFKVRPMSANHSAVKMQSNLYSNHGVDIIVSTPHLLASIAQADPNVLSRVSHLIIDEADSLFDRDFAPITTEILDKATPSLSQLVLCSATITRRLESYLEKRFPDIKRITTPNLHAIPRRVQLGIIDVTSGIYRDNKKLACADAIWSIGKAAAKHEGPAENEPDVERIMVFVNEREMAEEVADYLASKGIDAVALHRDTPDQRQSEMLASFMSRDPLTATPEQTANKAVKGKSALPNTKVIVATDLASRGLDTIAVKHVVLYDVPHTTIDFIHRLGRAGRMNRRGRGIVLVGKGDRKDVVAEVRLSMFSGQALV